MQNTKQAVLGRKRPPSPQYFGAAKRVSEKGTKGAKRKFAGGDTADITTKYFDSMGRNGKLLTKEQEQAISKALIASDIRYWEVLLSFPAIIRSFDIRARRICRDHNNIYVLPPEWEQLVAIARRPRSRAKPELARAKWQVLVRKLASLMRTVDKDRNIIIDLHSYVNARHETVRDWELYKTKLNGAWKRYERYKSIMMTRNLRLVITMARRYQRRGNMDILDLVQEGNLGLMKAVERFDPGRGHRFSTYASWWIRHAIGRGLSNSSRTIRVPVFVIDLSTKIVRAQNKFFSVHGHYPSQEELAEALKLSRTEVTRVIDENTLRLTEQNMYSFDQTPPWHNSERSKVLSEVIADDKVQSADEACGDAITSQILRESLEKLSKMEKDLISARFGLWNKREETLHEIGIRYNLSRERIRQIQERTLVKIRENFNRKGLARPTPRWEMAAAGE